MKRTPASGSGLKDLANFVVEDAQDFEALHARLAAQWVPDGPDEEQAVYAMAKAIFLKQFLPTKRIEQTERNLEKFNRLALAIKQGNAQEIEAELRTSSRGAHLRSYFSRNKFDSEAAWIAALRQQMDLGQEWEIAFVNDLSAPRQEAPARAEKLSAPTLDNELAYERQLDDVFERALDRLLKIKAEKRKIGFRDVRRFNQRHPKG